MRPGPVSSNEVVVSPLIAGLRFGDQRLALRLDQAEPNVEKPSSCGLLMIAGIAEV